jgi:hypothetical protein
MKEVGTRKEVLCRKAFKTKKGDTRESLTSNDKRYATVAKRSEGALNSPWRNHVLNYSKKNKISYANALADPNCKKGYTKVVKVKKKPSESAPS